jgi:hypothetical protein
VRKAIQVDPSRRYASASELRHALEAARPSVGAVALVDRRIKAGWTCEFFISSWLVAAGGVGVCRVPVSA